MCDERESLTDEELEFLRKDSFLTKVIKNRRESIKEKSFLHLILESPGGTALITVLFGGMVTGLITGQFNLWQKKRDLSNSITELYIAEELKNHQVKLISQNKLLAEALSLVGELEGLIENRIAVDGKDFLPMLDNGEDPKIKTDNGKLAEQVEGVRRKFNLSWEKWMSNKYSIYSRIEFYFGKVAGERWSILEKAMDSYYGCANRHHDESVTQCFDERNELKNSSELLRSALFESIDDSPKLDFQFMKEATDTIWKS